MEEERLLLEHAAVIVVLRNLLDRRSLGKMNKLRSKMNTIIECCHLFSTKVATARHGIGQIESLSFFTGP